MAFTKDQRNKIHSKYGGKCSYCGEEISIKQMQVDHIIPKVDFIYYIKNKFKVPKFLKHLTEKDVNHSDNLNPSCRVCNKWKSYYDLEYFRSELSKQISRLAERSANYRMAKKYVQIKETPKPIVFYFETIAD